MERHNYSGRCTTPEYSALEYGRRTLELQWTTRYNIAKDSLSAARDALEQY